MPDRILVVGATGLIGQLLVQQLVGQGRDSELHLLVRRKTEEDCGAATVHVEPNDQWSEMIRSIKPNVTISCLGSTMKKAGSKEAFAAIDRDLVGAVASASKSAGAKQFIAVSSTMADSKASSFYLKVKGQAEDAMRAEKFERLDIIRPGLLRGTRTDDPRFAEKLAIMVSPLIDMLLQGSLRRYRSIDANIVARAIVALIGQDGPGEHIHENDQINDLSGNQ